MRVVFTRHNDRDTLAGTHASAKRRRRIGGIQEGGASTLGIAVH